MLILKNNNAINALDCVAKPYKQAQSFTAFGHFGLMHRIKPFK